MLPGDVQGHDQHPGEGGEEEELEQDGDGGAARGCPERYAGMTYKPPYFLHNLTSRKVDSGCEAFFGIIFHNLKSYCISYSLYDV